MTSREEGENELDSYCASKHKEFLKDGVSKRFYRCNEVLENKGGYVNEYMFSLSWGSPLLI